MPIGTVTLYYKAMNQVSKQQLQRWPKNVWKTEMTAEAWTAP